VTPERAGSWVARWVRLYTRGLPAPVADRRREEIAADLQDQIAHARARQVPDGRIALEVLARALRGVAADVAWRRSRPKARRPLRRSVLRVALGVALVLSLPLVAMQLDESVVWSLADFVVAGVLLAVVGAVVEAAARAAGNLLLALAVGALGILAGVAGQADDAPGLVLLGLALCASAAALGIRRLRRGRHGL
jgi:hypothetical protein